MKRLVVCLIGFGLFFTSYANEFTTSVGLSEEVNAWGYKTTIFNNGPIRDAARAVYGRDGGYIFSRMFDNKVDGYKVNGKVWVKTSRTYTDSGTTWGLHQSNSPIRLVKDNRKWNKDYAGYSYCKFIR